MSLKRQTLWSMAPLLVVSVVNIFSVPLFYRYLGVEMFALWMYINTFTGLFGFADLGLGMAVARYVGVALGKGDPASVREYWGTGNFIALPVLGLMGLLFMVLGVVFGPKLFNVSPDNVGLLRACFVTGGVSLFLSYYGQFWNVLVQTHLDFKFTSVLRVGTSLLQVIPAVAVAWATKNPLWINLWSAFVALVQLVVLVWYSRSQLGLGFAFGAANRARAREMAAYTGKTFATLVAGSVFGSIDRVVLAKLAPSPGTDFAHYTICANVGARLQGLGVSVMGPVFHNTSRAVGGGRSGNTAAIYDEMFNFTFGWYLLAALWAALWHPVLLRLWLGQELGMQVAPVFTPLVIAACLNGIASISGSQLNALNRVGTSLGFLVAAGVLTTAGVYIGWQAGGVVGVAYGFLFSRLAYVSQDLFVIRLVKAGGWLSARTWLGVVAQGLVAGGFALAYLVLPRTSFWLLVPALLHAGLVAAWLLRRPLRRLLDTAPIFRTLRPASPVARIPE